MRPRRGLEPTGVRDVVGLATVCINRISLRVLEITVAGMRPNVSSCVRQKVLHNLSEGSLGEGSTGRSKNERQRDHGQESNAIDCTIHCRRVSIPVPRVGNATTWRSQRSGLT